MKRVVDSSEVAHLWAHQIQTEARNGNGSMYFEGDTIYSYGSHFPIAKHVKGKRGATAILFTTRDYSSTTAHHKSMVRGAIPERVKVFYVERPTERVTKDVIRSKESQAAALVAKSNRARTSKSFYIEQAAKVLQEAQELSEFFGLKVKIKNLAAIGIDAQALERARKVELENKRKDEQRRMEREKESIEAWKNGEDVQISWNIPYAYGRIQGEELVTSKGARVPIQHIQRVAHWFARRLSTARSGKGTATVFTLDLTNWIQS